jgi:hypothetical protein
MGRPTKYTPAITTRRIRIPAIAMVFPDPPVGDTVAAGGISGAGETGAGIAEAAGATAGCSRGVPQYSQNF